MKLKHLIRRGFDNFWKLLRVDSCYLGFALVILHFNEATDPISKGLYYFRE